MVLSVVTYRVLLLLVVPAWQVGVARAVVVALVAVAVLLVLAVVRATTSAVGAATVGPSIQPAVVGCVPSALVVVVAARCPPLFSSCRAICASPKTHW